MAVGVEEMRGASTLANGGSRADPEAGVPLLHQWTIKQNIFFF